MKMGQKWFCLLYHFSSQKTAPLTSLCTLSAFGKCSRCIDTGMYICMWHVYVHVHICKYVSVCTLEALFVTMLCT